MSMIKDIYRVGTETIPVHPPILDSSVSDLDFYNDYLANYSIIDGEFLRLYGNLSTDLTFFFALQHYASTTTLLHKNELDRLWNYTKLEYDPISNYDKHSQIIYLNDKITTENIHGEQKHLLDNITTTNIVGNNTITNVNEKTKTVVDEKNYGYNNSDGKMKTETTTTVSNGIGSDITNTTTDTGRTDSTTTNGTGTNGRIENIDNSFTDTTTTSGTSSNGKIENKVIETTSGNIGVQTATEMLEKEWEFWTTHNFWNYLFNLWKYELTDTGLYEFDE